MKVSGISGFRAIPGYEGRYEIDYHANIRRIWAKSGKRTTMRPSVKNGENVIKLSDTTGRRQWYKVSHIMAVTFIPGYKKGDNVFHIDGVKTNNEFSNLRIMTKKDLGKITGGNSRRKTVVKLTPSGEAVAFYSSAREAGRKNYMSYQTILDYCNRVNKKRIAPDGFIYAWENNFSYNGGGKCTLTK